MAEAAAPAATVEGPAQGGGKKKIGLIWIATFAGALLGGLTAGFVVAPRLIGRSEPGPAAGDSTAGLGRDSGSATKGEGEGGSARAQKLVELANVVVNPAGTQGTRFLMTSVAIAVPTEEAQKALSERQAELRDRITTILESETMAQLTAPGARDSLKLKIAAVVSTIAGPRVAVRIFLPQFVIQ